MSDFWHKLGCCVVEKPQPVSSCGPGVGSLVLRSRGCQGTDGLHPPAEEEEETD